MNRKNVIVAGHICLDITPVFPAGKQQTVCREEGPSVKTGGRGQVSDLLLPGALIQMGEADVHTGGAVANTGLAMKLLGADVSLMGKDPAVRVGREGLTFHYSFKDGFICWIYEV